VVIITPGMRWAATSTDLTSSITTLSEVVTGQVGEEEVASEVEEIEAEEDLDSEVEGLTDFQADLHMTEEDMVITEEVQVSCKDPRTSYTD
jgi:hypothetical protein